MNLWQMNYLTEASIGVCKSGTCTSVVNRRPKENVDTVSENIAARACVICVEIYLSKLRRAPRDRNAHYNQTIRNTLGACKKDILFLNDYQVRSSSSKDMDKNNT